MGLFCEEMQEKSDYQTTDGWQPDELRPAMEGSSEIQPLKEECMRTVNQFDETHRCQANDCSYNGCEQDLRDEGKEVCNEKTTCSIDQLHPQYLYSRRVAGIDISC